MAKLVMLFSQRSIKILTPPLPSGKRTPMPKREGRPGKRRNLHPLFPICPRRITIISSSPLSHLHIFPAQIGESQFQNDSQNLRTMQLLSRGRISRRRSLLGLSAAYWHVPGLQPRQGQPASRTYHIPIASIIGSVGFLSNRNSVFLIRTPWRALVS
jgi:hypothetical protein